MSAIKRPVLFGIAVLLGLVVVGLVIDRLMFLAHARHTTGSVAAVHARNTSCSCGRHCSYSCTEFSADVEFPESESPIPLVVTAGTARGHRAPIGLAQYRIGSPVPVIYNPRNTNEAYRDSFADVWGVPVGLLLVQIVTLVGSFSQRSSSAMRASVSPSPEQQSPSPDQLKSAGDYFLSGSSHDPSDVFGGGRGNS